MVNRLTLCYSDRGLMTFGVRSRGRRSPGRRQWRVALAVALVSLLPGGAEVLAQARQGLRVVPLVREERVLVSVELADGFSDDVRAAIRSGLKTTFTYTVELRLDVPVWFDRTIDTATLATSVQFDNLTRRYTVERMLNGRLEQTEATDDERLVRQWLTTLARQPLFQTSRLQPNREYYVRVNATARPSSGSILWPFGSGTSAQTRFTFIR
jgi:hypothetical protein